MSEQKANQPDNGELKQLVKDYLQEQKLMQLCTVDQDGNPWSCNVWQASDDDLNIYFFSSVTRRHSKEIENDGRVSGALALPQSPQDKPRGLSFQGRAKIVESDDEFQAAVKLYEGRIFDHATIDSLVSNKDRPHKFYVIKPRSFVLFDVINFPENSRQVYEVDGE